jgi:hypothetical protein
MPAKRTIHGEALTERRPDGWSARRHFAARQAWCPECHAKPGRKCTDTEADRQAYRDHLDRVAFLRSHGITPPAFDARRRFDHIGRTQRAQALTEYARQGAAVLLALAYREPRHQEPARRTVEAAALPLFALTHQEPTP